MDIDSINDSFRNEHLENVGEPVLKKQPFISAILQVKELIKKILDSTTPINTDESTDRLFSTNSSSSFISYGSFSTRSIDSLHFGMFSYEIDHLKEEGLFYKTIAERRQEIRSQKKHWVSFIDTNKQGEDREFFSKIDEILAEGKLTPNSSGAGSAYFLVDNEGIPRFVVKPVDEDIFCLNNRKELGSLFNDEEHRVREDIPLYRSAQTDAFCWEIASRAGLEGATPKAVMGILASGSFYDFTRWMEPADQEKFFDETGFPDQEKLSSIQEYIPDSQDLVELLHSFYQENLSDEEIASRFDQKEFEQVCLFIWLTYDNDAHGGNFRSYVKRIDEQGKKIYGIKKIDNGLSFPEKNTEYVNILTWMPNAIAPISKDIKNKIAQLPTEQILKRMDDYELTNCKGAFQERMEVLKELVQRDGITIAEIDLRFSFLSQDGGKQLALSPMTTQEILDRLLMKSTGSLDPLQQLNLS